MAAIRTDEAARANYDKNRQQVSSQPGQWSRWENIPGVAATAGLTGAALLARPAQAQTVDSNGDQLELQGGGTSDGQANAAFMAKYSRQLEPQPIENIDQGGQGGPEFDAEAAAREEQWKSQKAPIEYVKEAWRAVTVPVDKFKQEHINPIVRGWQAQNQEDYFGGTTDASRMEGMPAKGVGGFLRDQYPGAAYTIENVGKRVLGDTQLNSQNLGTNPAKKFVEDTMEQKFGVVGAAFLQSLQQEGGALPFYLIPGVGQSAAVQGATGGFLSALADPDQESAIDAGIGGAVLGPLLHGAGKVGAEVASAVRDAPAAIRKGIAGLQKREVGVSPVVQDMMRRIEAQSDSSLGGAIGSKPPTKAEGLRRIVAVVPGDEVGKIAEAASEMAPQVVADKGAKPLCLTIDFTPEGQVVKKVLTVNAKGAVSARPLTINERVKAPVVLSDAARSEISRNPSGELAQAHAAIPEPGLPGSKTPELDRLRAYSDIDSQPKPSEGMVLGLTGPEGSPKLINIDSPELQKHQLMQRKLVEVELRDGSKMTGFYDAETHSIAAPSADDFIPNAAPEDIPLEMNDEIKNFKIVNTDSHLNMVLAGQKELRAKAEAAAARQVADQQVAQADIALGGDGSGGKLPPGPPMDPPPPPPPNPHNVDPTEGIKFRYMDGVMGKIQQKLLNPTVRGARDIADLAFSSHSVDTLQKLAPATLDLLNNAVPELRQMSPGQQRAVHSNMISYLIGDIDLGLLKVRHPELSAQIFNIVELQKMEIAKGERRLKDLGMLQENRNPIADWTEGDEDWAVRMYWRFTLPEGEWAKIAKRDEGLMAKLQHEIEKDVYSKMGLSAEDKAKAAEDHLNLLLGDPAFMKKRGIPFGQRAQASVSKAGGSLKQRSSMPIWQRMALGEVDNAFVRIAESRSRQAQLIMQGEMWQQVAMNPTMSVAADDFLMHDHFPRQIPNDPGKYGHASGRFTTSEVWEAMVEAPLAQRNASQLISKSLNAIKYMQTVLNPGSWVTNFMANAQGVMLSNLVNPFASPFKITKGMLTFARDHAAFMKAPALRGLSTLESQRYQRAMELGVVGSEHASIDFKKSASDWLHMLEGEATRTNGQPSWLDIFPRILNKAKKTNDALARKYSAIDTMWKYATFTSGLEKAGMDLKTGQLNEAKAIKFLSDYGRYRPGMLVPDLTKQVELQVTQNIHYAFPMLDRVGEGTASATKYAGTIVNPYLKVKMELMRNYAQLPARTLREKGMAANLLGYAGIAGASYFAIKHLRETQGVNQEMVDQAFMAAPPAVQRFKPGAMALPSRAANGRLRFLDLTSLFEPFGWMTGDPDTAMPLRMLQNMAMSPIDGSLLEAPLAGMLLSAGLPMPGFTAQNTPEWQQSGALLLGRAMMNLGPGALRNTYSTAARGGDMGFTAAGIRGPQQTLQGRAVTNANYLLGPNRLFEAGGDGIAGQNDRDRAIQLKSFEIRDAASQMRRIGAMNEGQSTGLGSLPLNKDSAFNKAEDALNKKVSEMDALQQKLTPRNAPSWKPKAQIKNAPSWKPKEKKQ
jgi:hypothetical protein